MGDNRRFYWLKLHKDFFDSVRIKKLRAIAGGDTFTIIYLKLLLYSMDTDGIIEYEGIEDSISKELALMLNEDPDNVEICLKYLWSVKLAELHEDAEEIFFPEAVAFTGSQASSTQRVRDYRERNNLISTAPKTDPKSHAERQRSYRAKQNCSEVQHIPMIEDYMNRKRYSGNYYLVCQRDKYKCAMCGSTENLCVHHIDGYDENKPQNNATNKMVLLCRECHSNVHAGTPIPNEVLNAIGYWSDESDVTCNGDIEKRREDKEKEKIRVDTELVNDTDLWFGEFWKLYPRKVAKANAVKAFKKKCKDEQTYTAIMRGLQNYVTACKDKDPQYIAHPATWINGERWNDEVSTKTKSSNPFLDMLNDME